MKHAGFRGLANEWWHFDGIPRRVLKRKYRLLDTPLDSGVDFIAMIRKILRANLPLSWRLVARPCACNDP